MAIPVSEEQTKAREHVLSRSLTPASRRLAMGIPLYSCACGGWAGEDTTSFRLHVEVQPVADRIADELTDEMDLGEGIKVVYVITDEEHGP